MSLVQDIAALRDLLHHIDDLDDIIKKGMGKRPHVNEQEFTEILRNHPATAQLNKVRARLSRFEYSRIYHDFELV